MTALQQINDYYSKNNSITVLDPLMMIYQEVKSKIGYTLAEPTVVGNEVYLVNRQCRVTAVDGLKLTLKPNPGFEFKNYNTFDVLENSSKAFNLGKYVGFERFSNSALPRLLSNRNLALS